MDIWYEENGKEKVKSVTVILGRLGNTLESLPNTKRKELSSFPSAKLGLLHSSFPPKLPVPES